MNRKQVYRKIKLKSHTRYELKIEKFIKERKWHGSWAMKKVGLLPSHKWETMLPEYSFEDYKIIHHSLLFHGQ